MSEIAYCPTCGGHRRCYGWLTHTLGRLRYAVKATVNGRPKTLMAKLRLIWHDFVIHGLLDRGTERCQDCGRDYALWHADDDEWAKIMDGPGGLLCAACYMARGGRLFTVHRLTRPPSTPTPH
jgi:hypothetical protein